MTYLAPEGLISRVEEPKPIVDEWLLAMQTDDRYGWSHTCDDHILSRAHGPYSAYCADSPESDIDRRLRQPAARYLPADSTSTLNQYFRTIDK